MGHISYPRLPAASSRTYVLEHVATQTIQSNRVSLQCQLQRFVRLIYLLWVIWIRLIRVAEQRLSLCSERPLIFITCNFQFG